MVHGKAGASATATRLRLSVRAARPGDGIALAPLLRSADTREIQAGTGCCEFAEMLEGSIKTGEETLLLHAGKEPVALFGRSETRHYPARACARIWMVGSNEIARRPREILVLARREIPKLVGEAVGWNYVDSRNEVHLRFLRHLGARLYDREATTLFDPQVMFIPFEIEGSACVTRH